MFWSGRSADTVLQEVNCGLRMKEKGDSLPQRDVLSDVFLDNERTFSNVQTTYVCCRSVSGVLCIFVIL